MAVHTTDNATNTNATPAAQRACTHTNATLWKSLHFFGEIFVAHPTHQHRSRQQQQKRQQPKQEETLMYVCTYAYHTRIRFLLALHTKYTIRNTYNSFIIEVPYLRKRVARARDENVLVHGGQDGHRHHVAAVVCEMRLQISYIYMRQYRTYLIIDI